MKYIRSREIFESESELPIITDVENEYAGLSKEELKALLDQAMEDEDWDTIKKIGTLNQNLGESRLSKITHFTNFIRLDETVQAAKQLLQKLANKEIENRKSELEAEVKDLTGEEREAALNSRKQEIVDSFLNNPDYIEIRDTVVSRNPNMVGAFVRFRFAQGADQATVLNLYRLMVEYKDSIKDLPYSIDEYSMMTPSGDPPKPGYEQLGDEFNLLSELRDGRWIVKALPSIGMSTEAHRRAGYSPVNLRELFKAASREKQIEVIKAAGILINLNKPSLVRALRQKLSGTPTVDSLLDKINQQIKNAEDSDRGAIMQKAYDAYPSVAVMYEGPDHVVFSFRNDSQLPFLCSKAKSWCIQPSWYNTGYADKFWTYNVGTLQLGILDFTVEPSNPYHTVGATINPDRSLKAVCNQPDHCISGGIFTTVFANFTISSDGRHSYPQELIDAISIDFDQEVELKTSSDEIYQKIKKFSAGETNYEQAVIRTVTGMITNIKELTQSDSLTIDDLSANSSQNKAKQIVISELKNFKNSTAMNSVRESYLEKAKLAGISTPADVKIFELIMEDSPKYNKDLISTIITRNNLILKVLVENTKKADRVRAERFILIAESIKQSTELLEAIKNTLK